MVILKWGVDWYWWNLHSGSFLQFHRFQNGHQKIVKLLIVSDFNENWYLGVFWSEELVGNDEICSQGHFYEATIFKMAANKIVKLSMVWFQWKLISSDFEVRNWLVPWILIWGCLGTSVFASKHNQT
jgi:hypothetical protein